MYGLRIRALSDTLQSERMGHVNSMGGPTAPALSARVPL